MNYNNLQDVVLECSQKKGTQDPNGLSQWKNNWNESILINEGDKISIKQALINSANGSEDIIIDQDTTITMALGFYQTIPNQDDFTDNGLKEPHDFRATNAWNDGGTNREAEPVINVGNNNFDWSSWNNRDNMPKYQYYVCYNLLDADSNNENHLKIKPYDPATGQGGCHRQFFTYTLKAGAYSPDEISSLITDAMSKSDQFLFKPNGDQETQRAMFCLDRSDANKKILKTNPNGSTYTPQYSFKQSQAGVGQPWLTSILGATQTSMSYNDNRFGFAFHTPAMTKNGNSLTPITLYSQRGDDNNVDSINGYNIIYRQITGCFLLSLTSDDGNKLLDALGFTQDYINANLIPPNIDDIDYDMRSQDFEKYITGQFFGNANIVSQEQELPVNSIGNSQYIKFNQDRADYLLASKPFTNDTSGGYYLIEVEGGLINNKYYSQGNRKSTTSAIASKNYSQQSYITVYNESSIPYVHTGNPFNISNLSIRILNPSTNQPSSGLGNDNTVFVQIERAKPSIMDVKKEQQATQVQEELETEQQPPTKKLGRLIRRTK